MYLKTILLISGLFIWTTLVRAEATASKSFWNSALPVNYENELKREFTAGGKIQLNISKNGQLIAHQNDYPAYSLEDEMSIRSEAWKIFVKVNTEHNGQEQLTEKQIACLYQFSQTKYGAIWFRELAVLTIAALNKGYFEIDQKQLQSFKDGIQVPLSSLLTGEVSMDGALADDFQPLKILPTDGVGAFGEGICIYLGTKGFKEYFSYGGQIVDPMAIIGHEFGHTILGDYTSGENIEGEARTVRDYENPIRVINGFAPRKCYTRKNQTIVIETFKVYNFLPAECTN